MKKSTYEIKDRRIYAKPQMEVFKLQSHQSLLSGSGDPEEPPLPIAPEWPGDIPQPW